MPSLSPCDCLQIIIVDDNADHLTLMQSAVEAAMTDIIERIEYKLYGSASEAIVELPEHGPAVVICDYCLDNLTASDWVPDFVSAGIGPVLVVSASGSEDAAAKAFRAGASDYIIKSVAFSDHALLRHTIMEAQRRFELNQSGRNLTKRLKLANAELAIKSRILKETSETAHRFVEDVAHEFRTPLAVIQEFASIISDGLAGPVNDKHTEFLSHITNATRDLAELVDDFLDADKLRAGTLRVERRSHGLNEILDGIWPLLTMRAKSRQISLVRTVPESIPLVFTDLDKARRTIVNLVVNAIKFSPAESTVSISAMERDNSVHVDVRDHGPGMSQDAIGAMFHRFRQSNNTDTFGAKGFGLGLSIVAQLVKLNLGEVDVRSALGEGSTFSFTLPLAVPTSVIDHFLSQVLAMEQDEPIAAIEVRHAAGKLTIDDLMSALSRVSRPWDLVAPHRDGVGVLIAGSCTDPDAWVARLEHSDALGPLQTSPEHAAQLNFRVLGSWPIRDASTHLAECIAQFEGRTHAEHSAHR